MVQRKKQGAKTTLLNGITQTIRCLTLLILFIGQSATAESTQHFDTVKYTQVNHASLLILDRTSGRTHKVEISTSEPVFFGRLKLILKKALKNTPEFPPESVVYLEIFDKKPTEAAAETAEIKPRSEEPAFSGWMYASSPSINVFEHSVYNIKVAECF
ncbi:MAG: DUF2155 domain-containing protein [Holosporales bacterium]|jgi:hypothetical protein|nr:DUF2155 domain-containing protein [Holosporales bacterium]